VVEGELIGYKLAKGRAYDLVDAYTYAPHIEFANCDDFQSFLLAWGPLLHTESKLDWRVVQVSQYQACKGFLRAMMRMISACKGLQDQRESLIDFLTAEVNMVESGTTRNLLKQAISIDLVSDLSLPTQIIDPFEWARSASILEVRKALAVCVENWVRAPSRWGLRVDRHGRDLLIKPSFELFSLWDAMKWMLFFDEWNRRAPILCQECPRIFRSETAHERKFCTPECAHRAANRKWRRKDLSKHEANREIEGGLHGTRKTR
jgi:hypothetical protein